MRTYGIPVTQSNLKGGEYMKLITILLETAEGDKEVRVVAEDVREALSKLPADSGLVKAASSEDTDVIV